MLDAPPFAKKVMPGAAQQSQPIDDIDAIGEEQAGPEEQAQRDQLMKHAYAIMADEKAFPELEKMLQVDPENAIADATLTIVERVEKDLGEQDPDMLQSLAEEIVPELAELATGMGVDIPEDRLEMITADAIAKWVKAHPDRIDQQGMQAIGNATMQAVGGVQ